MGAYKNADHLYECIGGLFDVLGADPVIGQKLHDSSLIIRFSYTDPDAIITVDCQNPGGGKLVEWHRGEAGLSAEVTMSMKSDVAHRFWLGKVILLEALTRRQIVAKGPIPKILKLLPVIKPAYAIYKELLEKKGYTEMLAG
ncbi:MAG: hypothetical protein U0166_05800 [Acidobacteriota bacterium]